jgi:hypothetical protein
VPSPQFRLDELGSLEFQRLCVALLGLELGGIESIPFDTRPWGLSLLVDEGLAGLEGPALVFAVWDRHCGASQATPRLVEDALRDRPRCVRSLLLATNVQGLSLAPENGLETLVLGPEELWQRFAAAPDARLRAPSALGVADLGELLAPGIAARSTADIAAAAELARVFVPTRAYAQALAVLEQHRFAVLTGPPEMGKTAIARMIGLAALTNGWELHECLRPDDLWQRYDRARPQVFIADDAFGSTEYRPESAERWAVDLDRVLKAMDERHWLLWTSRPAPLKAALRRIHREHGVERFPQPAEVDVASARLDATEKALILFRHAKRAALDEDAVRLVQLHGWQIVSHEHFTPERIRRFVGGRLRRLAGAEGVDVEAVVAAEIREPTEAMSASYRALAPEHRTVLLAMLDVAPAHVHEADLTAAVRRHSPGGVAHPVHEIVDQLGDHFLRPVHPDSVSWVHPSWRDLVIDELASDAGARRSFLAACSIHGAVLALSTAGGTGGGRSLPLLVADADWDTLADRLASLIPELDAPEVTMLLAALDEARLLAADEGDALASEVLRRLARTWDRSCHPVPVALLGAWFDLAAEVRDPPQPPSPAPAWFDLVPCGAIDIAQDALAFDDWTALVDILTRYAPETLTAFGFPEKQKLAMLLFIGDAQKAAEADAELAQRDAVVRSLRRLQRLGPAPFMAADAATRLRRRRVIERVPIRPLSPELERLLEAPLPSARDESAQVERVLRDL